MAVSRYVPKDIKKYKPKYFWGFTSRQMIALIAAAVLIAAFLKLFGGMPIEAKVYASSLPAVVPLLFGFVRIYGMPLERFLPEVWHDYFGNAPKRYKITAPSLSLSKGKREPLKLDSKNPPLASVKK